MDLIAAGIAFFSVRQSAKPADNDHAFGNGKFESFSGLIEVVLIFFAALLIIWEAVSNLIYPDDSVMDSGLMMAGIVVMGVLAVVNAWVSSRLMRVAKETESVALESDAWHLRSDVYTSAGVFVGLILIQITGLRLLDSVIALLVAFVIIKAAAYLIFKTWRDLSDHRLTDEEEDRIRAIIAEHVSEYVNFHGLKTRRSGPQIFIEFHLVLDGSVTVLQAHDLTDHLESDIQTEFPRAFTTIHVEPCRGSCRDCSSSCNCDAYRNHE